MPSLPVASLKPQQTSQSDKYPATAPSTESYSGRSIHCSAADSNPAHSKGKVMSSGNRVVSQSMHAKAIEAAEKQHPEMPAAVRPQRSMQKKNNPPVTISTSGSRPPMRQRQAEPRPRSAR